MSTTQIDEFGRLKACFAYDASASPYDTLVLRKRANQWRVEAAKVALEATRALYLNEAEKCEQRLLRSAYTPVIREPDTARQ